MKVPCLISVCLTPPPPKKKQHHDVNSPLLLLPDMQLCQFEGLIKFM